MTDQEPQVGAHADGNTSAHDDPPRHQDGRQEAPEHPVEPPDDDPDDPVVPVSLRNAVWALTVVLGLLGAGKSYLDFSSDRQKDIRARADAEVQFFMQQYAQDAQALSDNKGDDPHLIGVLKTSVDMIVRREAPDMWDTVVDKTLFKSTTQESVDDICAARYDVVSFLNQSAAVSSVVRAHWTAEVDSQTSNKEALRRFTAYEKLCGNSSSQALQPSSPPVTVAAAAATNDAIASATEALPAPSTATLAAPCGSLPPPPKIEARAPTYYSKVFGNEGWRIDVFWCDADDKKATLTNYQAACAAYNTMSKTPQLSNGDAVSRVQLRELPVSAQGKGYPSAGAGEQVSLAASNPEESDAAKAAATAMFGSGYSPHVVASPIPLYFSAFACKAH